MSEPRWLPRLVVEAVHQDQLREHGGLPGLRDEHALEAALARPRNRWAYEPESALPTLAAAYAFALTTHHPFIDGNKRVAFLAMVVFLGLNGLEFVAPEGEVVEKMLALAAGYLDEESLTGWIERSTSPSSSRSGGRGGGR